MTDNRDLLASVKDVSAESEFFSPIPAGYKKGKTRYVIVLGTVMSGLGKGIFSSCLAKLMQDKGLKVAPIKLEGYLNIDSGTLNPLRHGEVFVLDDGMECDMDLGTYERMLDQNLTRDNFATSGQMFSSILAKERHGEYLGRDVQMIPHVTGEVKLKLRRLAMKSDADIVFVEIGIEDRTDLRNERKAWAQWSDFTDKIDATTSEITIGITGKYTSVRDSYASILNALEHAGINLNCKVNIKWIETTAITDENAAQALQGVDGIIVPGGFGTRGAEGKIACIKYARENRLPYLGLCFGFQMAVIEFARNVCGFKNAGTTEIDPDCKEPVIDILPEQKKIEGLGGNMRLGGRDVELKKDTLAWKIHDKAPSVRMRFRHRYEVDPKYIDTLEKAGMVFSGKAPNQPIMQILELPEHPFFMGTQAHPCLTSRPLNPQPLFLNFVKAALQKKAT